MTPTVTILVVLGGGWLLTVLAVSVVSFVQPKLSANRWMKRLRTMSPNELASEACRASGAAGIREHFPAASLFEMQKVWDWSSLLAALEELYKRLYAEDQTKGAAGPGSWVYYYYDFGIATIHEVLLEAKLERPGPE